MSRPDYGTKAQATIAALRERIATDQDLIRALRALLAEGLDLTKDANWSDAGDDWWGRAYDETRPERAAED